jgi:hypothetical protein
MQALTKKRTRLSLLTWVVLVLVVVTLGLGLVGYTEVARKLRPAEGEGFASTGRLTHSLDILYRTLELFVLGGRNTYDNPYLIIGRWTGALVAFLSVVKLLTPRLEAGLLRLRLSFLREHTVVIGLGEKGKSFLRDALAHGPVVGVDRVVPAVESLELTTTRVPRLVSGDAKEEAILRRAGVDRAKRTIVATPDDLANLSIAKAISTVVSRAREKPSDLDLVVHLSDPTLRVEGVAEIPRPNGLQLRPFSIPALAARALHASCPLSAQARLLGAKQVHLVLVGFNAHAQELLLQLARIGPPVDQNLAAVAIFTKHSARVQAQLLRRYPALPSLLDSLEFHELASGEDFVEDDLLQVEGPSGERRVTAIVVSAGSDTEAIVRAHRLRTLKTTLARWLAPIHVQLERPVLVKQSVSPFADTRRLSQVIQPFAEIQDLCSERGLQSWHERLAEKLHKGYRDQPNLQAEPEMSAACPWQELREEYREANRRAVDHLQVTLDSLGYVVRGEQPMLEGHLSLAPLEREVVERSEHASWSASMRLAGWREGSRRDEKRKLREELVPFDDLPRRAREVLHRQLGHLDLLLHTASAHSRNGEAEQGPTVFRERVIGLVGHNVVSLDEGRDIQRWIPDLLRDLQAPQRLGPDGGEFWTLVTPLAPGADLILAKALTHELAKTAPGRWRLIVVRCASVEDLVDAYLAQAPPARSTADGKSEIERDASWLQLLIGSFVHGVCEHVVEIPPARAETDGPSIALHAAFAALDGYLLERCDELVAVFDGRKYGMSGAFDAEAWKTQGGGRSPAHGTGQLLYSWLNRPPASRPRPAAIRPSGLWVWSPREAVSGERETRHVEQARRPI